MSLNQSSQFALLGQRRFAPLFWTQFLGAGNDNLFKFAFTILVTYQLQLSWLPASLAGLVIGALFILPFLLFSATAGQFCDKLEKSWVIRMVKNLEIGIMLLAAYGFIHAQVGVLLVCTFLMGLHSTLFGPVKYAYLPQSLSERELTGGNGLVEMGTFVAILLGNVVGGLLVAVPDIGHGLVAAMCVTVALVGRIAAQFVPLSPATDPALRLNWNPWSETWRNLAVARKNVAVFRSILGISWMWFFGAVFLAQFPSFSKDVMHGTEEVASLLLTVFSLGIGLGSLSCEMLSRRHVEIGLVPLGAIGMTVFAVDLGFFSQGLPTPQIAYSVTQFVMLSAHWRVLFDLFGLAFFAGVYSVPMYALIQLRCQPSYRARIIASNNILNALFIIASAIGAGLLLASGVSVPSLFIVLGVLNAVVAGYIFFLLPEYLLRFFSWILSHMVYRFQTEGEQHIPTTGPALLICNHVSFVDAVLLMAVSPRPIRFVMDSRIFQTPLLGALFRLVKAIPIAPQAEDPVVYQQAFEQAIAVLKDDELLAVFPEGNITRDGTLQEFRGGVMKILRSAPVPVIPMALNNLWGSFFSRIEGKAMVRPFRRGFWNQVRLRVGPPIAAQDANLSSLRSAVQSLLDPPRDVSP